MATRATFSAPRTLGTLAPQEVWARGMRKSLQELRRAIEHDGWVEAGKGAEFWAFTSERSASCSPTGDPPDPAFASLLPRAHSGWTSERDPPTATLYQGGRCHRVDGTTWAGS